MNQKIDVSTLTDIAVVICNRGELGFVVGRNIREAERTQVFLGLCYLQLDHMRQQFCEIIKISL